MKNQILHATQEAIDLMSKSVKCLALELPEPVWNDVAKKWQSVLDIITPNKVDANELPTGDVLLLTTSKVWIIGDWYKNGWRTAKSKWEMNMEAEGYALTVLPIDAITHWLHLPTTA